MKGPLAEEFAKTWTGMGRSCTGMESGLELTRGYTATP